MRLTSEQQNTLIQVAEQLACERSEEELLHEIGLRARTFALCPAAAGCLQISVPEATALERAWDDLDDFGYWIFRRLHKQLKSAQSGRGDRSTAGIVSALTTRLGVAPAIASVFAALAMKRLLKPAWDAACTPQPQFAIDAH